MAACWSKLGLGHKGGSGSKTIRKVINTLLGSGHACKYDLYTKLEVSHNSPKTTNVPIYAYEGRTVCGTIE